MIHGIYLSTIALGAFPESMSSFLSPETETWTWPVSYFDCEEIETTYPQTHLCLVNVY